MKILITGGAGFIGLNLSKKLVKDGHTVTILDNFSSSSKKKLQNLELFENINLLVDDVCHTSFKNCDALINLACPASPPRYQSMPLETLDTCFLGTKNCLDFCLKNNIKLIHASTSEIYGDPLVHPQKEDYYGNVNTFGPRSCYDEGKRISETLCYEYKKKGAEVNVIRIFNTYGPYMDSDDGRVISNFINQALKDENITIYGDGTQTRSFCFIDDLVDGISKILDSEINLDRPINLGNPEEYNVSEIANKIIDQTCSRSKIVFHELPKNDPLKRKPCIESAKNFFSWQPKVSIDEGIRETVNYFRSKL